jgi:outer membrane receptor protein involved in Fe transport
VAQVPGAAIPPQSLASALQVWAEQTGWQLLYDSEVAANLRSGGAAQGLRPDEALLQVLDRSGLVYQRLNERTVLILSPTSDSPTDDMNVGRLYPAIMQANARGDVDGGDFQYGDSGAQHTVHLPDQDRQVGDVSKGPPSSRKANESTLTEVLVTAQKRTERLQDVPVRAVAVDAESLLSSNQLRIQDYYASIPGVSLVSNGSGASTVSIRGITTGSSGATVGIVVDDVPFGSSTSLGLRVAVPDIDPSELSRVEVLSGPQGTLYGANSIGGLLKFVTVDPSTDRLSGHAEARVSSVNSGNGAGYGLRAAVNLPVTDTFAVRASGFTRRDPGYIDGVYTAAPALHVDGINKADVAGGRLSALWQLSDTWSIKLSALYQETDVKGQSYVTLLQPGIADLQQMFELREALGYRDVVESYTGTLAGTFRDIKITSITGYNVDDFSQVDDGLTDGYGFISEDLYGISGVKAFINTETKKFTQELRFSGKLTHKLDWLAGLFYTHEDTPTHDIYVAVDPVTLAVAGPVYDDSYPSTFAERAAFGDLTFHLTDRFDIQVGGRGSKLRGEYHETLVGPGLPYLGETDPTIQEPIHAKTSAFTYLLTPSLKISPDLMAYARVASGYRPGAANYLCTVFPVPCRYAPDKTSNYEIGVKGQTLGNRLFFDASAYYINWKDIQLTVANEVSIFILNANKAKSQGFELSLQAKPTQGLTLAAWAAWNDAKLTEAFPQGSLAAGAAGDRLPYSSPFSGHISVEEELSLLTNITAFARGSLSYIGDRKSNFQSIFSPIPERLELPSYVQIDAQLGFRFNSTAISVFLNNATDERGIISGGEFPQASAVYIQPRTVGISLSKNF